MKNKAQTAMEYLMTYGWAILIVIVVIAALYAMGVFTPQAAGGTCSPCFSNFAFVDYAAGTLVLTTQPRDINITAILDEGSTLTAPAECTPYATTCAASTGITITGIGTSGIRNITIVYDVVGGVSGHIDTGKIHN